jgi:hypothetical protein
MERQKEVRHTPDPADVAEFNARAKDKMFKVLLENPFYSSLSNKIAKDCLSFDLGGCIQIYSLFEDFEKDGARLFSAILEFPVLHGPKPDLQISAYMNRVNAFSPVSPLVYNQEKFTYKFVIRVRANPDNLAMLVFLFPRLATLQILTAKKVFETIPSPKGLESLVKEMDPTSTQRLVEIEADIKNQGATKSSRWDKLELFSTSSGLESFLEKAPEGNLETIRMKFPFMDNSSDFMLDSLAAHPWLGRGLLATTTFPVKGAKERNQTFSKALNDNSFSPFVEHSCFGCLYGNRDLIIHKTFVPNSMFFPDLAQHLASNAYMLSTAENN